MCILVNSKFTIMVSKSATTEHTTTSVNQSVNATIEKSVRFNYLIIFPFLYIRKQKIKKYIKNNDNLMFAINFSRIIICY